MSDSEHIPSEECRPAGASGAEPLPPLDTIRPEQATRDRLDPAEEGMFKAFVLAQTGRLGDLARKLDLPEHVAEEILQESLTRLWRRRPLPEPSTWEGWLWKAMHFRRLIYFRSLGRAAKYAPDMACAQETWQEHAPPDAALYSEECDRILRALVDALAPERREVVTHYLLEDVPMDEVAARLGIPESTAKDRWRLAQLDMRAAWDRGRAHERWKVGLAGLAAGRDGPWKRG